MRRVAAVAVLSLVCLLTLGAAGCGGDDEASSTGTPVDEWADEFCTTVKSWTDELQQITDRFDDPSSLNEDAIREAGQDLDTATESFVDDLRALGSPDTESGDEIRDSLDSLSDALETERSDVDEAVEGVSGLADLPGAITTIGTSLQAMGSALQNAFDALENADVGGELEAALEDSEACDALVS